MKGSTRGRGRIWWMMFVTGLVIETGAVASFGQESTKGWLPRLRDYDIQDRAKDCAAMRSTAQKAKEKLKGAVENRARERDTLKVKYAALTTCAGQNGLSFDALDERQRVRVAELCPDAFQEWINNGYLMEMYEQDFIANREVVEEASKHLVHNCGQAELRVRSGSLGW